MEAGQSWKFCHISLYTYSNEIFHEYDCHIPMNLIWNSLHQKFPKWASNSQKIFSKKTMASALLTELLGIHMEIIPKWPIQNLVSSYSFPLDFFLVNPCKHYMYFPVSQQWKCFRFYQLIPEIFHFKSL